MATIQRPDSGPAQAAPVSHGAQLNLTRYSCTHITVGMPMGASHPLYVSTRCGTNATTAICWARPMLTVRKDERWMYGRVPRGLALACGLPGAKSTARSRLDWSGQERLYVTP